MRTQLTDNDPDWAHEEGFRRCGITCPVCMRPVYEKSRPGDDYVEQRCKNYENGCQGFRGESSESTEDDEEYGV